MWQGPRKSRQKCTMDDLSSPQQQQQQHCLEIPHQNLDVQSTIATTSTTPTRSCGHDFIPLAILPHVRRAHLQFPPPPNYPPPHHPSTSKMSSSPSPISEEHHLGGNNCMPGPSTQQQQTWEIPTDYSYAYYVPGPPTKHTNVPSKYPGAYREGSYRSRHTYLTRYGTEENIYEEISEFERARLRPQQHHHYHHHHHHLHQDSVMSINQSLVEEEVRRIQTGHRRVLGELNLSVEAMLMPPSSSSSREGSEDTDRENETDDQLADLLTIGPTDDLLSPVPLVDLDSGFSGSSSGASYRSSTTSSLRRCAGGTGACVNSVSSGTSGILQERPKSTTSLLKTTQNLTSTTTTPPSSKGFWGKKAWKKLTGFPSTISLNKPKDHGNN